MTSSQSPDASTLLDVGRIVKPHGLRGEVIVELTTNRSERLDVGSVLTTTRGELRVVRSAPHQHRWIVAFDGVNSRETADDFRDVVLRAAPLADPDALWVHELIGCVMRDQDDSERGAVVSVLASPGGDLLELATGALVPLRFVRECSDGVVRVDVPEGLFDL